MAQPQVGMIELVSVDSGFLHDASLLRSSQIEKPGTLFVFVFRDFQSAAAQIEILDDRRLFGWLENFGRQAVIDEPAIPVAFDQPGDSQNPQMVGNGHNGHVEFTRDFADVLGALAEAADDPQTQRISQGLQAFRTRLRLQWIVGHEWCLEDDGRVSNSDSQFQRSYAAASQQAIAIEIMPLTLLAEA
jgi:hypothetical protein